MLEVGKQFVAKVDKEAVHGDRPVVPEGGEKLLEKAGGQKVSGKQIGVEPAGGTQRRRPASVDLQREGVDNIIGEVVTLDGLKKTSHLNGKAGQVEGYDTVST